MKKNKETKDMETYLEANASKLVESSESKASLVRAARADEKRRIDRAARLQKLRRDKLHLSQRDLARAVGANVRTLQSWERGRQDYPKSVEILMGLMQEMPTIKKKLLPDSKGKSAV